MPVGTIPTILDEVDVAGLFAQLPSFYQRFISDPRFLRSLLETYVQCAVLTCDMLEQVGKTSLARTTETMRIVPFFPGLLHDGLYTVAEVKSVYPNWDTHSLTEKVQALEAWGRFERLEATRSWEQAASEIVSLEIHSKVGAHTPFSPSEHWVLRNNQLFLFGALATPTPVQAAKLVFFKNVHVNYRTLEDVWGQNLQFPPVSVFNANEYRDILAGLQLIYLNGPYIPLLRQVLQLIARRTDVGVYDKYSPNNPVVELWSPANAVLGPFDFVVHLPTDMFVDGPNGPEGAALKAAISAVVRALKPSDTSAVIAIGVSHTSDSGWTSDSGVTSDLTVISV